MNADQIKHMTERFLQWKLPADFNPDAGISFEPSNYQEDGVHRWPVGTNLFDYTQAEAMVRFMVEGLSAPTDKPRVDEGDTSIDYFRHELDGGPKAVPPKTASMVDEARDMSIRSLGPTPEWFNQVDPHTMGWKSIKSVPRDGTWIIFFDDRYNHTSHALRWNPSHDRFENKDGVATGRVDHLVWSHWIDAPLPAPLPAPLSAEKE